MVGSAQEGSSGRTENQMPNTPPVFAPAEPSPALSAVAMAALIERQIVPRLWALKRGGADGEPSSPPTNDALSLPAFAAAVLAEEPDAIDRRIAVLMESGVAVETVFLDWLAPAARLLGQWWQEDRVGFTDVTIGLGKLHQLLHRTAARGRARRPLRVPLRRAYFAAVPGEQHGFGLAMLEEIFQLSGWETSVDLAADRSLIVRTVGEQFFDIIGFSASGEDRLEALPGLIRAVRGASRNQSLRVLVGGAAFRGDPARASQVGADGTAEDAQQALRWAEQNGGSAACTTESDGRI